MTTVGNPYISADTVDQTGKWIDLDLHRFDGKYDVGVSFHIEDTGNTGTVYIEASNDPRCIADNENGTSTAAYDDISADLTIPTFAGAADGYINISNLRFRFVRYKWDYTSGASVHTVYCNVT